MCLVKFNQVELDWANSVSTYPQTGHHSCNIFRLGIFYGTHLLCDITLKKNSHLYTNLSNSIQNIFNLQAKLYPQSTNESPGTLPTKTLPNVNYIHRTFAHMELCPQQPLQSKMSTHNANFSDYIFSFFIN